jgi:tRNA(Ile)-lysidine synthase
MSDLVAHLGAQFKKHFPEKIPDKILIALSGGIDSMALVYAAHSLSKQLNFKLHALTINHNLRGDSTDEAAEINILMQQAKIKHEIISWEEGKNITGNIEGKARQGRYDLLVKYARENNIKLLVTAHHNDDQMETFLMRLSRGSGIDGLAAMRQLSQVQGITLFRPFLDLAKLQLEEYIKENKIKYFQDESNFDEKILRNKLRKILAELSDDSELLKSRILQTAAHMQRAKDYFKNSISAHFQEYVTETKSGYEIFFDDFCNLHPEIAMRLLVDIFHKINGGFYKPRFKRLVVLYEKIIKQQIQKNITMQNCLISVTKNNCITFTKE